MIAPRLACGLAALVLAGKSLRDWRSGSIPGEGKAVSRADKPLAFHIGLTIQMLFALFCGLIAAGFLLPAPNTDMS